MADVPHLSSDEFRQRGRELIDWIADYWEGLEHLPVAPGVEPGDIRALLPRSAPDEPEPFADILSDLDRIIVPGLVHWQSPRFFGYFPANASPAAVLGELASAGLGVLGMMWSTSPAATELESVVLDWLIELLDLPAAWRSDGPGGGVIQMSASDATHTALVVARHTRAGSPTDMVAYASSEAHSSVEKGVRVAGIDGFRRVSVDRAQGMDAQHLAAVVAEDVAAGRIPVAVVSTVGTTGTAAVDPLPEVSEVAARHGMWHHVDAAYAGSAMVCSEFRHLQQGLELVDSYTFNPHKWMLTNFDCSAFYVADRRPLLDTLNVTPPYLRNAASESGTVVDYRDWHVPLGRRFRALKLWFVLRSYGAEGIRTHIRNSVSMAAGLAERVESDPRFDLVAPARLSLVCFAHVAGNDATDHLASALNASGRALVTPSELDGRRYLRVAIGQPRTEPRHVDELWDLIDTLAQAI